MESPLGHFHQRIDLKTILQQSDLTGDQTHNLSQGGHSTARSLSWWPLQNHAMVMNKFMSMKLFMHPMLTYLHVKQYSLTLYASWSMAGSDCWRLLPSNCSALWKHGILPETEAACKQRNKTPFLLKSASRATEWIERPSKKMHHHAEEPLHHLPAPLWWSLSD